MNNLDQLSAEYTKTQQAAIKAANAITTFVAKAKTSNALLSNESFAQQDELFRILCDAANVEPTARQASKYRNGKGAVATARPEAVRIHTRTLNALKEQRAQEQATRKAGVTKETEIVINRRITELNAQITKTEQVLSLLVG